MISVIIIGKNVQKTIRGCIFSILDSLKANNVDEYEILYVDSNSADSTVEIVKAVGDIRIIILSKPYNAAIARNVGAENSSGKHLLFIDGDMELDPRGFGLLYSKSIDLEYPFITGDFINIYKNNKHLSTYRYYNNKASEYDYVTGGLFFIERNLWERLGGMKTSFRRSQDLDFGLRSSNAGFPLLRKPIVVAKHITIDYHDNKRFLSDLLNGNYIYKGLLIRKNIFNKYLHRELSFVVLIVSLISSIFFGILSFMGLYVAIVFMKVLIKKHRGKNIIKYHIIYSLIDLSTFVGVLMFYPRNKNANYMVIC